MEQLNRAVWTELPDQEKEDTLRMLLDKLPEGFVYKGMETFERYGSSMTTGVYEYKEREFVLVPGDQVTLGWDRWQEGMDEMTAEDLQETVSEYEIEDVDGFIRDQMSPVRQAVIEPLLVERRTQQLGWTEVSLDDSSALADEDFQKEIEKFKLSAYSGYMLNKQFRLDRQEGEIRAYVFNSELTYEGVLTDAEEEGFSLPNEDEWEYLYGGGCRTLFPWGDSFNYELKFRYFEDKGKREQEQEEEERPYDLELPNVFGLYFAGDPYQYELTSGGSDYLPKGGDGGGMLCGGMGQLMGYLPATAVYYRDGNIDELDWEELIDHLNIRRLIRLP